MIRSAVVGVGFMGWMHALAYRRSTAVEMAGFASRSETKRAGDWRGIQGNFGPPGEKFDVSDMAVCESLEGLLADDSIDLIDICLPPHLHAGAVEASLAAGKWVLCEKPLALTAADAERLVSLASPGQLMVGHILPLIPEFALIARMKADGRYGRVLSGRFQRTIGPPDWIPDFYDLSRVGGPLLDLQVHDAHLIRMLFGMPSSIHTVSHDRDGVPKRYESVLEYEDAVVSVGGGVIDSPARPFSHGYEVSFEQATVRFEFAEYADGTTDSTPPVILHNDGRIERPEFAGRDPVDEFVTEIELAASVVAGAPLPPVLDPRLATDAIKICEMQMRK